ncbi:MAG: prepilin-type N-terminal cleavage/methylation domain-containing protein [Alphaproteobacteria bacterium]
MNELSKFNKKAFSLIELSIVILIIGILVAGVTQSSRLVRQIRLATASQITRSSEISTIKDLVFWAETSLENSLVNTAGGFSFDENSPIQTWNDNNPQSTLKINVSQATSAYQPFYKNSGINGLPSLSFNGGQLLLSQVGSVPLPANDKNYTFVIVWRANNVNAVGGQILMSQDVQSGAINALGSFYVTGGVYGFAGNNNDLTNVGVVTNKDYISIITVNNNVANNISIYTNSNTAVNGNTSGPGGNFSNLSLGNYNFGFGARISYSQFYSGLISEAIVVDRIINAEEIKVINNYLSKKYAIKIS